MLRHTTSIFAPTCRTVVCRTYNHPVASRRKTGNRQKKGVCDNVRDIIGMTIPEARLRRDRISAASFDRCIEENARNIIGLGSKESPGLETRFGARYDRRDVRFVGRADDVRRFTEEAARSSAAGHWPMGVTFVRGEFGAASGGDGHRLSAEPTSHDLGRAPMDVASEGTNPMLRRVLRRCKEGVSSSLTGVLAAAGPEKAPAEGTTSEMNPRKNVAPSTASTRPQTASVVSPARRRVEKRLRRRSAVLLRGGESLHPCSLQGGCGSQGGSSNCAFVTHPSTACVQWLRLGRCEEARLCSCPWWHPAEMEVLKPEFLHSYFFGIAEGDERGLRPLRESCAAVGRLLQMFLDIIVSTIFEALRMETTNNEEVVAVGRVEDLLSRAGKGKGGNSACICNLKDGLLSVERELCVSALMGDDEGVTCTESADGETSGPHFDGESTSLLRNMEHYHKLHADADKEVRNLLVIFRAYFTMCDDRGGNSGRVIVSASLTQWLLRHAASCCSQGECYSAGLTPIKLFEEASVVLLRDRLHRCGIDICGRSCKQSSITPSDRSSPLLLLQHVSLLSNIVTFGANADQAMLTEPGQQSLLYSVLLCLQSGGVSCWLGDCPQQQYVSCWLFMQSLLSVASVCLLRLGSRIFSFARPVLVEVGRRLAKDIEVQFEAKLLRASGWAPWTDAQMFGEQHRAIYTASDYARTHMPVVARAFTAAMLNILLLNTLRAANREVNLCRSPVAAVIFSGEKAEEYKGCAVKGGLDSPMECVQRESHLRGGPSVRRSMRPYAQEAMSLIALLHDEGAQMLARRQALMEEFLCRRKDFDDCGANELNNPQNRRRSSGGVILPSSHDEKIHVFEKLLPHGSISVCGDGVGLLLRVLLEGGSAYGALRLAASAVHVGRALRFAARQPMPHVHLGEKVKHKHMRNSRTGRKYTVRVRVPVLRSTDPDMECRMHRKGQSGGAQPVALYLRLNQQTVEEMVRLALRMGGAGERLLSGVVDDCVRGLLLDYGKSRCLPAVKGSDVHDDGAIAGDLGARELQGILSVVVGTNSNSQLLSVADEAQQRAVEGYRVPPTALLVELLVALTPQAGRGVHERCTRLCAMDPHLVSERTLLAKQCHTAGESFARANDDASAAWLSYLNSGVAVDSGAVSVSFLRKEAERLPVVDSVAASLNRPPLPRNVEELRRQLTQTVDAVGCAQDRRQNEAAWSLSRGFAVRVQDPNSMHGVWWAVMCGAILGASDDALAGKQRPWARLLLRNAFHVAQQFAAPQDRARYGQATVRAFILSGIFELTSTPRSPTDVSCRRKHLPWQLPVVHDLNLFLAAQVHLAQRLHKLYPNSVITNDCGINKQLQLFGHLKLSTKLEDHHIEATACWSLLEPLTEHSELAITWLQESLFHTPQGLLAWIIACTNNNCNQTAFVMAAWVTLLCRTEKVGGSFNKHVQQHLRSKCTKKQVEQLLLLDHCN
ncbi:hypothetical protein, conserved [Trypanosoma brucei gambiense DAL972]|uniref:Uncharacterized protein n=1 Tax=Trypanosoma brucei gambiense (strain MHOM/CI/86/DAL972) TaxID=679716 RepID=C9ZVU9_TRYB9|nr:hypothetical protein, conserved [Trypanosoma brucei gambiense DAL972]CBH13537.1 hypothetical protein, conserved [Trypanosoma brucei gambiense DAL972]|eukprot:XP_011775814.1 hypothetical protein, conserved [Trypanosoma brucei gambiense DAL972]